MDDKALVARAFEARQRSYSPYSGFAVGAALLSETGEVWHGCNIENAAYSPTNCAERTALFTAVAAGCRRFTALAVAATPADGGYCTPCGVCRQVLAEFCEPQLRIIMARTADDYIVRTLAELLPLAFG